MPLTDLYPLCLGGNVFGWTADKTASEDVLDTYVAHGGNLIDTADMYSCWVDGQVLWPLHGAPPTPRLAR